MGENNQYIGRGKLFYIFGEGVWVDTKFTATSVNAIGATGVPDFNTTEIGWNFDKGVTEAIYIAHEMDHDWKEGSEVHPHIHWVQASIGTVAWQLSYKVYDNLGSNIPAAFTVVTAITPIASYSGGTVSQINAFPIINMTGLTVSAMIKMIVARVGGSTLDTYNQDAILDSFDLHWKKDAGGSVEEYDKWGDIY